MGLFRNVGAADVNFGGKYFDEDCAFIVRVEKCITKKSRKKEDLFIVECTVVETTSEKNAVGSRASQVIKLSQDAAPGNVKAVVAAMNGLNPDVKDELDSVPEDDWETLCDYMVSRDNPAKGVYMALATTLLKTKDGGDFTKHNWTPIGSVIDDTFDSGQAEAAAAYGGVEAETTEDDD